LRHKFLFSIFVFFFISIFIALGTWQLVRLNWKTELISQIDGSLKKEPVSLINQNLKNFLRIKATTVMNFDKQIYLYSLNSKGEPGFDVITPITVEKKNFLLNRGWIPFDKKNSKEINDIDAKSIIGTLKKQIEANRFKPKNNIKDNYWFTLDRKDIFKYTGKNFSPFLIYLNSSLDLPKSKVITSNITNNHKKYAITWFSLAISIFLFYLYFKKKNS